MVRIPDDEFERMVGEVFDALPDDMVRPVENVAILIEDQPAGARPRLFGLYSGRPLTSRSVYGFGELPDRIVLFREPLLAVCDDLEHVKDEIHVTLVHEIAHFYGIDDDELHRLGWG